MKKIDLVSYLPPFMADFKEITVALKAENPEFVLVWNAAEQVLQNEFIETADEYGISRFEKILNILPSREDTLETRRSTVLSYWLNTIPYTLNALVKKLKTVFPNNSFKVKQFDNYRINVETSFESLTKIAEVEKILETMIPCNILVEMCNNIPVNIAGTIFCGGVSSTSVNFTINVNCDVPAWD